MSKRFSLALAALIVGAPLVFAHTPEGTLKNYCEDPSEWDTHDYVIGPPVVLVDGNIAGDCNGDTIPADFDGHSEWMPGGAVLMVESGDGVTSGSVACYGEPGHHPELGPISVDDVVFADTMPFTVAADTVNLVPPTDPTAPECGDFQADESTDCSSPCTVTFTAGVDGAYHVFLCLWIWHNGDFIRVCAAGHVISV